MGRKKPRAGDWGAEDDQVEQAVEEEEAAAPAKPTGSAAKQRKGKRGKKPAAGDWASDEEATPAPAAPAAGSSDEETAAAVRPVARGKARKAKAAAADYGSDEEAAAPVVPAGDPDGEEAAVAGETASTGKGKKGGKVAAADQNSDEDAAAPAGLAGGSDEDGAAMKAMPARKGKGNKARKAAAANWGSDEEAAAPEAPAAGNDNDAAASKAKPGAKGKVKKGKRVTAGDWGSDEEAAAPVAPVEDSEEEAAPVRKPAKGKGRKKQSSAAAAAFALLAEDPEAAAEAEAEADADAEGTPAELGDGNNVHAARTSPAVVKENGVAHGGEEDAQVAEPESIPESSAQAFGGKRKKKKGLVDTALLFATLEGEGARPAAPADEAAELEQQAAAEQPGSTEPAAEDDFGPRKRRSKKKGKADLSEAFEGLGLEADGVEDGQDAVELPAGKEKRGRKGRKAAGADDPLAQLDNGAAAQAPPADAQADMGMAGAAAAEEAASAAPPGKQKKKKGKGGHADADIDSLLAELDRPSGQADVQAAEAAGAAPAAAAGKKKRRTKAAGGDEDIDALLASLDKPSAGTAKGDGIETLSEPAAQPQEAVPATAAGNKKKKKGKAAGKNEDEDLDAVLAELGMAPPATAPPPAAEGAAAAAPPAAEAEPGENDGAEGGNDEAGEDAGDGKELTAAQKKKLKKKAKDKAKKAGDGAEAPAAAPAPKGGKKVSAAVRKMQEEVAARKAAEEEAQRLAEEEARKAEEEERLAAEAEAHKQEEAERRKAERTERRAQLKREGKLLTGKAKAEAARLAAVREQFLRKAGVEAGAADEEQPIKKRVVYGSKKKPAPKPKPAEAAAAGAAQPTEPATTAGAAPASEQADAQSSNAAAQGQGEEAKAAAEAAPMVGGPEDLEASTTLPDAASESSEGMDDWEAMDVDAVPALGLAAKEEEAKRKAAEQAEQQAAAQPPAGRPANGVAPASRQPQAPEGSEEDSAEGKEESSEEEESSSEEEESSSGDESTDSEEERERRLAEAREKREARLRAAVAAGDRSKLRSPICCILGHVDTGKTKILDNVRRTNVQDGEAGGITQQIGATYIPDDALTKRTASLRDEGEAHNLKLPGLLIIDTPGHESFTNLRSRGSSLCDIAILVVDLMHGLEQQTIESINLLKMRKTPFIIALNKVDRVFDWKANTDAPIQKTLDTQKGHTKQEFERRLKQSVLNLNEQGLNVALYWQNTDRRKYVNIVPTSAITGEGIPDMLQLLVDLTQSMMASRLMVISETQCTVLEVKVIEGLGTTIDVVLVNGMLHEGDTVVLCGMGGPIVTQIRSLLTPHPLKELRVRGSYLHHKEIRAAQGVKIAAQNLESAVAGTQMLVVGKGDDLEALKDEVMEDMADIFSSVDRSGEGVCVQASTLGSLEALLEFLKSDAVRIPVSGIAIGPVHKRDIMRASVMLEKGRKKFACLLAFDVPVTREAREMADSLGVRVFTADIIYHLFDQFTAYLKEVKEEEQEAAKFAAVFPCILNILPNCVFNTKDPIVVGVDIMEGQARIGTPLCIPSRSGLDIGRIASIELNHKPVDKAGPGDSVAMKIEPSNATEATRLYGRHFDHKDALVSRLNRKSIDLLKLHFKEQMSKDDWRLVVKLKGVFRID